MKYTKPTTSVSRLNIATRLLAGSSVVIKSVDSNSIGPKDKAADTSSQQQFGGFML